jgi:uncharacterized membrane protein
MGENGMRAIIKLIRLALPTLVLCLFLIGPVATQAQPGKFDLTLWVVPGPGDSTDMVKPGQEKHLFLEVRNNSNSPINGIRFSSTTPDDWKVAFSPQSLDSLSSGSTYAVDVTITPPPNTGNGNYTVSLIATANETRAVTSAFLRVEGGLSVWAWVGFGVIGLIIIVFILVYLRYGRK